MAITLRTMFTQNMGKTDRTIRTILGVLMLMNSMMPGRSMWKRAEMVIGGLFIFYGLTGHDPALKAMRASTIPGAEDNVLNQLKQTAPGQGINPILTEQPVPNQELTSKPQGTTKEMTTVP